MRYLHDLHDLHHETCSHMSSAIRPEPRYLSEIFAIAKVSQNKTLLDTRDISFISHDRFE